MIINCVIIDDEPYAIKLLEQHVSKIPLLKLMNVFSDPSIGLAFVLKNKPDLIFLDINMPNLNGLEFASLVDSGQKIIFTTAYSDYAVDSYEKNAIDYLLKPITFDRFVKGITKAESHFASVPKQPDKNVYIKSGRSLRNIAFDDIYFIEGQKDYAVFHLIDEQVRTLKSLREIEESIPPEFIRIHHSYIINTRHIIKIEDNHVHIDNIRISITDKYRDHFTNTLRRKLL